MVPTHPSHLSLSRRGLLRGILGTVAGVALFPGRAAADSPILPPDPGGSDPTWVVTISEASLRARPEIADDRFGFARAGTSLQVLDYTGEWAYVYNPHTDGTAYVASNLLAPGAPPSPYVSRPAPPLVDTFNDTAILTQDAPLTFYPSLAPEAVFQQMQASAREAVIGTVRGEDGALWYQTSDFYYFPADGVFTANQSGSFGGRWLLATLLPITRVEAYEGQTFVRKMLALRGIAKFPTPTGVFSIVRRVPNETMDSMTLGIPHNSPYGYLVKNVLWTQYFTGDGASFHDNYWSSNFGGAGSHGCLGLSLGDSQWLWNWASIGTPVVVNSA
jgi:L,D-transpeptidase catalytic domain